MLRSISLRSLVKALPQVRPQLLQLNASSSSVRCFSKLVWPKAPQLTCPAPTRIQSALFKTSSGIRLYTATTKGEELRKEQEKHRKEKLKVDPEAVSTTSSVRAVFESSQTSVKKDDDADMLHGIKSDLVCTMN